MSARTSVRAASDAARHGAGGGRHRRVAGSVGIGARTRSWLVAAVAAAAIVGVGGTAHAVWSSRGAGSGTSSTGSATASVTLSAGTATGALRPGSAVTLSTTATNPNGAPLRITSLVLDTTRGTNGVAVSGATGTCAASWFTYTASTTGWTVPANGSTSINLPGALAMATAAPTGCQGATVTVYLQAGA